MLIEIPMEHVVCVQKRDGNRGMSGHSDSFYDLSPVRLHRKLHRLLTGTLVHRGVAPHTGMWLTKHNYHPCWGYRQSANWAWGVAGGGALDNLPGSNWNLAAEPIIYYTDDQVMPPYAVAVYAADECLKLSNQTLASSDNWMALGVFGLLPPTASDFEASIQLAVNQNGVVRGYAIETATRRISEVTGGFDRSTKRLAWTLVGGNACKFETSAANLLEGESLVNAYDPIEHTMVAWQLVRDVPDNAK